MQDIFAATKIFSAFTIYIFLYRKYNIPEPRHFATRAGKAGGNIYITALTTLISILVAVNFLLDMITASIAIAIDTKIASINRKIKLYL